MEDDEIYRTNDYLEIEKYNISSYTTRRKGRMVNHPVLCIWSLHKTPLDGRWEGSTRRNRQTASSAKCVEHFKIRNASDGNWMRIRNLEALKMWKLGLPRS